MRRWLIGITLAVIAVAASPPARAQVQQGSLTTTAADCGNPPANSTGAIFVAVGSSGGATITVSGSGSGTISFLGTGDGGTTYTAITSLNNSNVSTATGPGTWQFNPTAYTHICAAFTSVSSGTFVVTIRLSTNSAGHGGSGGGGGGGITGTVSSPFLPFASGADTLSDSEFSYDATNANTRCFAQYDTNKPPCIWDFEPGAPDFGDSAIGVSLNGVSVNDINDGIFTYFWGNGLLIGEGSPTQAPPNQFTDLQLGTLQMYDSNGQTVQLSENGNLTLGLNADVGGSLTLNDPTGGSGTLGITGGGTYFTISNSLVVGTTTFSPPTFPFTSVEAGEVYVNDALGNITAEFSDLGALMLGANSDVPGSIILNGSAATGASTITVSADGTTVGFDQAVAATEIDQNAAKNFAGTCMMATSTACTFTAAATFNSTPICIASVQSTTLTGGASSCALSGTTVTITAAVANSLTWAATLIGNPN